MLVFLPNQGYSTADVVSEISLDHLNNWLDTYTERGIGPKISKI